MSFVGRFGSEPSLSPVASPVCRPLERRWAKRGFKWLAEKLIGGKSMNLTLVILVLVACGERPRLEGAEPGNFDSSIRPVLAKHCFRCHGPQTQEAELRLDRLNSDLVAGPDADKWHEVLNRLNVGEMPPEDEPQPTEQERDLVTGWLNLQLQRAAAERKSTGGQVVLRRLNRVEYGNTLRDLLGLDIHFEKALPPEALSEEGFRNNGRALGMSPLHFEYYVKIARTALGKAIVTGARPPQYGYRFEVSGRSEQAGSDSKRKKDRRKRQDAVSIKTSFLASDHRAGGNAPPKSASANLRVRWQKAAQRFTAGSNGLVLAPAVRPMGEGLKAREVPNPTLKIWVRDFPAEGNVRIRVRAAAVEGDRQARPALKVVLGTLLDDGEEYAPLGEVVEVTASRQQPEWYVFEGRLENLPLPFQNKDSGKQGDLSQLLIGVWNASEPSDPGDLQPGLFVDAIEFEAPVLTKWPPQSHQRIFFPSPDRHNESLYARQVIQRFMDRAFRRPATPHEVQRVFELWKKLRPPPQPSDSSAERSAQAVATAEPGLRVDYFEPHSADVAEETLASRKPTSSGVVEKISLDFPQRKRNDAFAVRFSGGILIEKAARYTFFCNSDDGSRIYLDGQLVVDNDGRHRLSEKSGTVELAAGWHSFLVTYFDNGGSDGLAVSWAGPGFAKSPIPPKVLAVEATRQPVKQLGPNFEESIQQALTAVLASPQFLYLLEPHDDQRSRPLTDFELATRLSYFLWASMPDDQLLELARSGDLRQPEVLAAQINRMLADNKSWRFVESFTAGWLDLDALERVAVNKSLYPAFHDDTREAMRLETLHFFAEVLRSDESALNFIDSDFTMLNPHLAQHYGIEGVQRAGFQRVTLQPQHRRGGLLAQASTLTGQSTGSDSHPVKRGVWLLARLLDSPPPPPPPNVPELDREDPELTGLPIKRQLELHRDRAACNSCHRRIDPWGLAFEQFDAVGLWRENVKTAGKPTPVDATARLPDGQQIHGLQDLKAYLLEHRRAQFARAMVRKLLAYALGRSLELSDELVVAKLTEGFQQSGYQLRRLIGQIVASEPFQRK